MSERDVFVVSAVRTAIGTFGGSLKDVPPSALATTALNAANESDRSPLFSVRAFALLAIMAIVAFLVASA